MDGGLVEKDPVRGAWGISGDADGLSMDSILNMMKENYSSIELREMAFHENVVGRGRKG